MKKFIKLFFVLIFLAAFLYFGCKGDELTSSDYSCNQECQDQNIGYGITYLFNSVWEQHLSNLTGNVDTTVNGPKGGNAHITGSIVPYYPFTVNLIFDMIDCKDSDENFNLTLNGALNISGSMSFDKQLALSSVSGIAYAGTVGKRVNVPVNDTCQIYIDANQYGLSGTICGRSFSYFSYNK